VVIPAVEDLQDELVRLSSAISLLIDGPSHIVDDIVEVEIGENKLTIAPLTIEENSFFFIISEGVDNYISLRSSLYNELEIRLPMPAYLRVGKLIVEEDLC
jgi:hypothetical protein